MSKVDENSGSKMASRWCTIQVSTKDLIKMIRPFRPPAGPIVMSSENDPFLHSLFVGIIPRTCSLPEFLSLEKVSAHLLISSSSSFMTPSPSARKTLNGIFPEMHSKSH